MHIIIVIILVINAGTWSRVGDSYCCGNSSRVYKPCLIIKENSLFSISFRKEGQKQLGFSWPLCYLYSQNGEVLWALSAHAQSQQSQRIMLNGCSSCATLLLHCIRIGKKVWISYISPTNLQIWREEMVHPMLRKYNSLIPSSYISPQMSGRFLNVIAIDQMVSLYPPW